MLTPEPGTVVGGKYRILHALGEGGMGTVYAAENLLTLKQAAIKWLHPRLVAVQEASQRLLHEARATARIRHRNVVDIYDVVLEGDSVFLIMELLLGEQLSTFLAREQLAIHEVIGLLLPAMRGVAAAHAAGVVHRDIKPDNIFLAREPGSIDPVPKIIDFGISRIFETDGARLTRSGMTMGTPRYVSYEQLRGLRDVDARCDVYAFGVMLYEAVLGRPPYQASTFSEQAISFVTTVPCAPRELRPELPERLDALIASAIAKEREQRPASMDELIAACEPFAQSAAYAVPMPAYCLELSTRPALANPAGTTAPLTPTPVPSEPSPPSAAPRRSPPPPRRVRRWRERSLQLAALGLFIWAVLFVMDTWKDPAVDDRGVPRSSSVREQDGKDLPNSTLTAPELTDRPISQPNAPSIDSHAPSQVRRTGPLAEPTQSTAASTSPPSKAPARVTFPKPDRSQSAHVPTAPSTVTISEQSKVEPAHHRVDGATLSGEAAQDKSAGPSRTIDEASQKLRESTKDEVHRAGRMQRQEF